MLRELSLVGCPDSLCRWCQVSYSAKEPEFLERRHCDRSVEADVSGALIVNFSELLAGLPPL